MEARAKKILIASSLIGAVIIVVGAIILRSRRKKIEKNIIEGNEDILVPAQQTATQVIFPLKRGSGLSTAEKNAVKVVQRYINARMTVGFVQLITLDEDGDFGPLTESALIKLSGVNEVSYSLYKEMYNYLYNMNSDSSIRSGTGSDPAIAKNDLLLT